MKTLIELTYSVVKNSNRIHALGLGFNDKLLASVKEKIRSFDNSTWSRPFSLVPKRYSAKSKKEREEYFIAVLKSYSKHLLIPVNIPTPILREIIEGV